MRISEWRTRKYELAAGLSYKGGAFIRRIMEAPDDDNGARVRYTDYGVHDGASIGIGSCSPDTFIKWAEREATDEEDARLHRSDFQNKNEARFFSDVIVPYARAALGQSEVITDDMLRREATRRGITL